MKEEAGGMHRGKPCAAPCERRIGAIVRFSQMVGYWAAFGLQMVGYWAAFGTVKSTVNHYLVDLDFSSSVVLVWSV